MFNKTTSTVTAGIASVLVSLAFVGAAVGPARAVEQATVATASPVQSA